MAVKIRMLKLGANRDPSFRIVATDSRSPRDGKYLEKLGWYDPKKDGINFDLNLERIEYWKNRGAQVSRSVSVLVRKARKKAAG
ncbi:MAG: 30S ribosomal protein S16 [Kiritimatiellae bacterium]|nr:30S ribosomal protein S16 [Kiritimatiellia bacterium]